MKKIIRTLGLSLVVALAVSCSKDDQQITPTNPGENVDPATGNIVYTLTYTSLENTSWKYSSVTVPIAVNWDGDPISNTDLLKENANNCKWDDTLVFGGYALGVMTINDLGISCKNPVTWRYSLGLPTNGSTGGISIFEKSSDINNKNKYGSYTDIKMYKTKEGKTYLSLKGLDPTGKQEMNVVLEKI